MASSSHSYASTYPSNLAIDPAVKAFFEAFYAESDKPDAFESYAQNFFTSNASMITPTRKANGTAEIIETRKGMWTHVKSRKHTVHKVFPFGEDASEVMMQGTVEYGLKNGKDLSQPWAGYAKLSKEGGEVKMSYYQIYMVSALSSPSFLWLMGMGFGGVF